VVVAVLGSHIAPVMLVVLLAALCVAQLACSLWLAHAPAAAANHETSTTAWPSEA
jgi:hypothetical protein